MTNHGALAPILEAEPPKVVAPPQEMPPARDRVAAAPLGQVDVCGVPALRPVPELGWS